MMLTLERWLGEDVMARIMRTYYERWKFRHPTTEDFIRVAEEVSGRRPRLVLRPDPAKPGQAGLRRQRALHPGGQRGRQGSSIEKGAASVADGKAGKDAKATAKRTIFRNVVVIARYGEWVFPQELLVTFADGRKIRESWDGKDRWKRFVYELPVKVVSAEIDPDRKLAPRREPPEQFQDPRSRQEACPKGLPRTLALASGLVSLVSL